MRSFRFAALLILSLVAIPSCCDDDDWWWDDYPDARHVGLTVEVRDGATGFVLEGALVELVSVEHEWSGCVCTSPFVVEAYTNSQGRVRFDTQDFADAEIGFQEDGNGHAVLCSRHSEDQALVTVDIDGAQYGTARVVIELSWDHPDRLVVIEL